MTNQDNQRDGVPPKQVHVSKGEKKTNWLAWLSLAAGVLALLFALGNSERDDLASVDRLPGALVADEDTGADAGKQRLFSANKEPGMWKIEDVDVNADGVGRGEGSSLGDRRTNRPT